MYTYIMYASVQSKERYRGILSHLTAPSVGAVSTQRLVRVRITV